MTTVYYTRAGMRMNLNTRHQLIDLLCQDELMTQDQMADNLCVSPRTIRNYLTHETWNEVRRLRKQALSRSLSLVDRAVFAKAATGDIAAAKIVYSRWDDISESSDNLELTDLTLLNTEIIKLETQIEQFTTTHTSATKEIEVVATKIEPIKQSSD